MPGSSLRFGPFTVDRMGYRVLRGSDPVDLTPKLLDLLLHLVDHAGTLVTKEQLLEALWPDANVTDNALAQAMSDLRGALGDDPSSPQFIKTITRRGYRFIAHVETIEESRTQVLAPFGIGPAAPAAARPARDTASLDAHRAFTEGSLRLESLDVRQIPQAIADFERAVATDARYALAYAGLASAELAMYETTRSDNEPADDLLVKSIQHARHAVQLDSALTEAHATLALVLVSASETAEASAAARRAVAAEPTNWRHLFRLGHATWGDERLRAAQHMLALYPDFAFAHFQQAMVHVARGHLSDAETVLRQGAAVQDRQIGRGGRYPALGLHWLLGFVRLALDDHEEAIVEFDREVTLAEPHRLYGPEYAMNAWYGRGEASLRAKRFDDAIDAFRRALTLYPEHARIHLGLARAFRARGSSADEAAAFKRAESALAVVQRTKPVQAGLIEADLHTSHGRLSEAVRTLDTLVKTAPPGFAGWTIPVEPFASQLHADQGFNAVLATLADRTK